MTAPPTQIGEPQAASLATPPAPPRATCAVAPWPTFDCADADWTGRAAAFATRYGYVVLRDAVSPTHIAELAAVVRRAGQACDVLTADGAMAAGAWAGSAFDDPRWITLLQRVLPDPAFLQVGDAAALLSLLSALFADDVRSRRGDICRIAPPAAPQQTTRPHQDHWYLGGPPVVWTAWLPLHDCEMDQGGMGVIPGSHRAGFLPHSGEGNGRQGCAVDPGAVWASADLRAGDALLFHCMTVHRAWHNLDPSRPRVSVDYRYQPAGAALHTDRVDGTRAGAR